jgi:uncharacterized damage-inducible protein DinB
VSTREFFINQFRAERPKFVSVIRAMRNGKLDYTPHEKNTPAGPLAWILVLELRTLLEIAQKNESRWQHPPHPGTFDEIADEYDKTAAEFENAIAALDDHQWEKHGKLLVGEKAMMDRPVGEILWDFLLDAIHHRGQLSTYIRPMGGKVPPIYGPSGDSQ